jgi:hypothetical protein
MKSLSLDKQILVSPTFEVEPLNNAGNGHTLKVNQPATGLIKQQQQHF